jgi:CubicO group peptidase (beta-lactamase class C family)
MAGRHRPTVPVLLALTVAVLLPACTATEPTARTTTSAAAQPSVVELVDASDALLARLVVPDEPGCSAAVGIEGEVVWAGVAGIAELDTARPIETSTTFAVASVSKQFTATVVLLLAHDGVLSLDDPLSAWLPGLPAWSSEVTVGQAMHHVSGIPDYVEERLTSGTDPTDPLTLDETLSDIAAVEALDFPPGEQFAYSNSNYMLLAEVVREATGRPLPDLADELLFGPLDLEMLFDSSGWSPDSTDLSSARGYVRNRGQARWDEEGSRWEADGAAGVQTTPSELVRWADNYRTGRVGGDALLTDVLADSADTGRGERYGAGIIERPDGTLWHGGEWAGFLSDFAISADRRTAVAVSCNGFRGRSSTVWHLASSLQQEWFE